jgi:hypothetical protein
MLESRRSAEVFWPLATFFEPVADQIEKLIYWHSGSLCFGSVKISERLGP